MPTPPFHVINYALGSTCGGMLYALQGSPKDILLRCVYRPIVMDKLPIYDLGMCFLSELQFQIITCLNSVITSGLC